MYETERDAEGKATRMPWVGSRVFTALTVQQPWAWLIVKGYKPIENRTWRTDFRGRLVIHAGKTFDTAGYLAAGSDPAGNDRQTVAGAVRLPARWLRGTGAAGGLRAGAR